MRPTVPLLLAALLTGCATTPTATAARPTPTATPTPAPTVDPSNLGPLLTQPELRYLNALEAALKDDLEPGEELDDHYYLDKGRSICGEGDEDSFDFNGPPTLDSIIENDWFEEDEYRLAIKHLCPKYLKTWKRAQGGFGEGTHTVGKDIKPGTYRTVDRPVSDCYWERSTGSGDIIANNFINNAPAGVTLTVRRGEGFTSRGCGSWVPA